MESDTIQYLLAAIAGFAGGSLVSAAARAGYTPDPGETPRPRLPCIGWCPPIAGLILAVIIWAVIRDEVGRDALTNTVVPLIVGIAAAGLSLNVQESVSSRARR